MKKSAILQIATCIAIFQLCTPLFAQEKKPWGIRRVYVNANASVNSNGPATVQLSMDFNNRWTGFIAYENANPESKNQPIDYRAGSGGILGIQFNSAPPSDQLNLVTAGMGKVLTKPSDKAWVIATGGISIGQYRENQYTPQEESYFNFFGLFTGTSPNYSTTMENKNVAGLSAGLEAHANLFRFMGLSTGAKLLLTNLGVYPSFNFGMNIGLMRPSKRNMIKNPQ